MSVGTCLEYTLRVAVLQILLERRASLAAAPPETPVSGSSSTAANGSSAHSNAGPSTPNGHASTPSIYGHKRGYGDGGSISSGSGSGGGSSGGGFFAFDLGSLVSREGSKSPKFPKEMLRVLDEKLKRISMGQETRYSDARFRRTAALFWGKQWAQESFQRQLKDSRKIEDIILPFVTTATKSLKDDPQLPDGQWKFELNTQIALFISLLSDSLNLAGGASPELMTRLENYKQRLKATPPAPASAPAAPIATSLQPSTPSNASSLSPMRDKADTESIRSFTGSTISGAGLKGKATDAVWKLFGMHEDALAGKLRELQSSCTETAALEDLKNILKLLNTDRPFPYGPSDFAEPSTWAAYRAAEVSTLSSMMLAMMQSNPGLVQASDRDRQSASDLSARMDRFSLNGGPSPAESPFTYIPPDPRSTYRELLSVCLDWDLEMLKTLPEDEDVSLGVLSPEHVNLLSECATRWRIPQSFRTWVFLEEIVDRCEQGLVPSACIHEAMGVVAKVSEETPIDQWAISDREGLVDAFLRRDVCLITAIETSLIHVEAGYLSPEFADAVNDYLTLADKEHERKPPSLDRAAQSIVERIRIQAYKLYIAEASERYEHEGGKTRAFAVAMAEWIEKGAKKLIKKFKEPLLENVDIVALVLVQQLTLWFRDLEDTMRCPPPEGVEYSMEEAFGLYRRAGKLVDMGNAFSSEPLNFSVAPMFESTVSEWLNQTGTKTRQWADQALAIDTFEPSRENGPSSSVTDLFDSFRSASDFLMELEWPDEHQLAKFATRLAKIFSMSVNDYCQKMEQLFAADMRQNDVQQPAQAEAKQRAWIEKAKSTIASLQGERKITAFFNFTPASCVKLNNIEAARQQLDKLYQDMRVDDLAAYEPEPVNGDSSLGVNFLFSVKIVLAEGLSMDGSNKLPDAFVILSDEHGNRYAKTRTIYDDADPRWDETFDIPVRGSAWFMATLRHRTIAGKHDLLGRSYLRLDPSQHVDLISKDVLLPLDTRGHILLRISMEGERDDIQFHFGRGFRWLKRTESDMVRMFVDKMTPVLRHTLSRASIKSVLKPAGSNALDYNQALDKISAAYRSAMGANDYSIPPPPSEKPIRRPPSDAEIETAIHPLFDYLDSNNHTLASTLSADAMQSVMAKLWKQILMTIEALIVPPLSDKPSHLRALSDGELDIALKWLKFLRDFFYAGGAEGGVPLSTLQNTKYNEIMSLRIYYDWATDDLMEECIKGFQTTLKHRATKPSKSLLSQRNLGTIRARKSAKKAMAQGGNNTEMIMRILRMRPGTQEFLAQQIQIMSVVKMENPKKTRSLTSRFSR